MKKFVKILFVGMILAGGISIANLDDDRQPLILEGSPDGKNCDDWLGMCRG